MNFKRSASKVHLVDGHILKAVLKKSDGSSIDAELDLNECIGNQDGWFRWDSENFSHSAQNIKLEGDVLSAELKTEDGKYQGRQGIELSARIVNDDGVLMCT